RRGECHIWTGPKDAEGRGIVSIDGTPVLAHVASYHYHVGGTDREVRQTCGEPLCIRPEHLRVDEPEAAVAPEATSHEATSDEATSDEATSDEATSASRRPGRPARLSAGDKP